MYQISLSFQAMIYLRLLLCSLDKLKPRTKNQKKIVGVNGNSTTFLYTLNRGGQENIFLEGEKMKKRRQQKNLVFSFSSNE